MHSNSGPNQGNPHKRKQGSGQGHDGGGGQQYRQGGGDGSYGGGQDGTMMQYKPKKDKHQHHNKIKMSPQEKKETAMAVVNVDGASSMKGGGNSSNNKQLYQMLSQNEIEQIEKLARSGQDDALMDLFERLRNGNRQITKRVLNSAMHATVEGCNSTTNVERHINCLHTLVDNEAVVNQELNMKTILMIASAKGFIELVREIINMDANINQVDANGMTALHFAINNKAENYDVVKLLLENKADIHVKTYYEGITPLLLAVQKGHLTIVKMLIEENANLEDADTFNGNTALHFACEKSFKDIVTLLATEQTYSQLFNIKNKQDKTAYEIAQELSIEFTMKNMNSNKSGQNNSIDWDIVDYLQSLKLKIDDKSNKLQEQLLQEESRKQDDKDKHRQKKDKQMKNTSSVSTDEMGKIKGNKGLQNKGNTPISQHQSPNSKVDNLNRKQSPNINASNRSGKYHQSQSINSSSEQSSRKDQRAGMGASTHVTDSEDTSQHSMHLNQKYDKLRSARDQSDVEQTVPQILTRKHNQLTQSQIQEKGKKKDQQQNQQNQSSGHHKEQYVPVNQNQQPQSIEKQYSQKGNKKGHKQGGGTQYQQQYNDEESQSANHQNSKFHNSEQQVYQQVDKQRSNPQQQYNTKSGASKQQYQGQGNHHQQSHQMSGGSHNQSTGPKYQQKEQKNEDVRQQNQRFEDTNRASSQSSSGGANAHPSETESNQRSAPNDREKTNASSKASSQNQNQSNQQQTQSSVSQNQGAAQSKQKAANNNQASAANNQQQPQASQQPGHGQQMTSKQSNDQKVQRPNQQDQNQQNFGQSQPSDQQMQKNPQGQSPSEQLPASVGPGLNQQQQLSQQVLLQGQLPPNILPLVAPNLQAAFVQPPPPVAGQIGTQQSSNQKPSEGTSNPNSDMPQLQGNPDLQNLLKQFQMAKQQQQPNQDANNAGGPPPVPPLMQQDGRPQIPPVGQPFHLAMPGIPGLLHGPGQPHPVLNYDPYQQQIQTQLLQQLQSMQQMVQASPGANTGVSTSTQDLLQGLQKEINFGSSQNNWLSDSQKQEAEREMGDHEESQQQEEVQENKPRLTLPIRVSLDLSDEKSQDLFIYQQKYNTKKEEYLNLEKKKKQYEQENKDRDNKIEKLKEQNLMLKENNIQENLDYSQSLLIAKMIIKHNQLLKKSQELNDFNDRFCKQLKQEATRAADLLKKCQSTPQADKKADEIKEIIKQFECLEDKSDANKNGSNGLLKDKMSYYPFKQIMKCKNQASNILQMEQVYERPLISQQIQEFREITGSNQPGMPTFQQRYPKVYQSIINLNSRTHKEQIHQKLSQEIVDFNQGVDEVNNDMKDIKEKLIEKITQVVQSFYPDFQVNIYGSQCTGFSLYWSDIDLIVGPETSKSGSGVQNYGDFNSRYDTSTLQNIKYQLEAEKNNDKAKWLKKIDYIDARWPLNILYCSLIELANDEGIQIKEKYKYMYEQDFMIDMGYVIDNHNPQNHMEHTGIKVIHMVAAYKKEFPVLRPLMLVFKQMLQVNGLNKPRHGGLGSYSLLMLIVGFLQMKQRDIYFPKANQQQNYGYILTEFLRFYSQFDCKNYIVAVRLPAEFKEYEERVEHSQYYLFNGVMTKSEYNKIDRDFNIYDVDYLQISDPLQKENDISRASKEFRQIQIMFGRSLQQLHFSCTCSNHFSRSANELYLKQAQDFKALNQLLLQCQAQIQQEAQVAFAFKYIVDKQTEDFTDKKQHSMCESLLSKIIYGQKGIALGQVV